MAKLDIVLSPDIDTLGLKGILEDNNREFEGESVRIRIDRTIFFGEGASLLSELIEWFILIGRVLHNLKHLEVMHSDYDARLHRRRNRTRGFPLRALGEIIRLRRDTISSIHFDLGETSCPVISNHDDRQFFTQQLCQSKGLHKIYLNLARLFDESFWSALGQALRDVSVNGARPFAEALRSDSALVKLCQQQSHPDPTTRTIYKKPPLSLNLVNWTFEPMEIQTIYTDKNSRLAELKLKHVDLNEALFEALLIASVGLKYNTTLKILQFWFPDNDLATFAPCGLATTFLNSLEKNNGLESLSLGIRIDFGYTDPLGKKLSEAIHKIGSPLKKIELCFRGGHSNEEEFDPLFLTVATIIDGLRIRKNKSLVDVHICLCYNRLQIEPLIAYYGFNEKLARALESNTSLQKFVISYRLGWEKPRPIELNYSVQFWLKLNQLGRICSFEDRKEWMEAVIDNAEDHSILYHLILDNPSFLVLDSSSSTMGLYTRRKPSAVSDTKLLQSPPQKKQKLQL